MPSPSLRTASPPLGTGAHLFPWPCPCHPLPDPALPHRKIQPRRAAAAVNRPILMHITPNITTGGTHPFPCNPLRPSALKRSHPWPSGCLHRSRLGLLLHQLCPWLRQRPYGWARLSGWSSREALLGSRAGEGRARGQGASPKAHQSRFGEARTSRSWSPGPPWHTSQSIRNFSPSTSLLAEPLCREGKKSERRRREKYMRIMASSSRRLAVRKAPWPCTST